MVADTAGEALAFPVYNVASIIATSMECVATFSVQSVEGHLMRIRCWSTLNYLISFESFHTMLTVTVS